MYNRNAYALNTNNREKYIKDLIRPKTLKESSLEQNSHHADLVNNFKMSGNYKIPEEYSNTSCYERVKNMNYAKEVKLSTVPQGSHVSVQEYKNLKTNNNKNAKLMLPDINNNDNSIKGLNELKIKNNDYYFYKNTIGNKIKNNLYNKSNK